MEINNIYLLGITVTSFITAYLAIREARSKRDSNISGAVKNLSDALGLTSNELVESLTDSSKLRDDLKVVKEELETQKKKAEQVAKELETHRAERDKEIEELKRKQQADIAQTQLLQIKVDELTKQVADSDRKYQSAKRVIQKLVQALDDANIPVPDLNGDLVDLSESVKGLKRK